MPMWRRTTQTCWPVDSLPAELSIENIKTETEYLPTHETDPQMDTTTDATDVETINILHNALSFDDDFHQSAVSNTDLNFNRTLDTGSLSPSSYHHHIIDRNS